MAGERFTLARVEGGAELVRPPGGGLRLQGPPPRQFERMLLNRPAPEAVILTQQISADGGIAHALAALSAWEAAGDIPVAENGQVLRDILHTLSLMHAHLRQFYLQALPDYLPPGSLKDYPGNRPGLLRMKAALAAAPEGHWSAIAFPTPLEAPLQRRLWENMAQAHRVMGWIRRMMALIGGKFPVIMSLAPSGVNLPLDVHKVLTLRRYLGEVEGFLKEVPLADGTLLVEQWQELTALGTGSDDFICVGLGGNQGAVESDLSPAGILLGGQLEPFEAVMTESIHRSYYGIPLHSGGGGGVARILPGKAGAYSWIKAPRHLERPLETGPLARLIITNQSGGRTWRPNLIEFLEEKLGRPLRNAGSVAGRMLARLAELGALTERVESLLDRLDPAQPLVVSEGNPFAVSGEGLGLLEAPAGALQHRVILDRGKIVHYDIIAPSTWNGAPRDQRDTPGPLESALNSSPFDPNRAEDRLALSRIVHSFAFSMTDAVQ